MLKMDWATHEAAKYACENWHYSKCMPVNKLVKVGAWEDNKFIGVVIFSPGASANLYKGMNISPQEGCELTRVALTNHKEKVSKILSLAIKFLKKSNPKLRLIISFADPAQGHHGGIYQATNWVYVGKPKSANIEYFVNGKWIHNRSARVKFGPAGLSKLRKTVPTRPSSLKHKYLMPLDDEMRAKIEPLRKPYPKRAESKANVAPEFHSGEGGVTPTSALQSIGGTDG